MSRTLSIITLLLSTSLLALPALADSCGGSYGKEDIKASYGATNTQNIVETAVGAGSFTTLVSLLQSTGLDETLAGEGPFTVFAPTDEAFAKVPKETLASLQADPEKLKQVLTYHVVSGEVGSKDVVKLSEAATVEGSKVMIDASEGVKINNATVTKADIATSNGVIHVIDTVLIPGA